MGEVATLINLAMSTLKRLQQTDLDSHKVQKLKDPVTKIYNVLLVAENKRISDRDFDQQNPVKNWVKDVSKALYEADDLVDEAAACLALSKVHCHRSLIDLASKSRRVLFGLKKGPEIKRLCIELAELEQVAANDIGLLGSGLIPDNLMLEPRREVETAGYELESEIIGRENEKEMIVARLLDTSNLGEDISVVAIVGMGGIGKTTLAQSVYNDERVTNHFDLKMWVHATDFDLKLIISSIVRSCSPASTIGHLGLDQLLGEIGGKMFFLVLDDVWNESHDKWLSLRDLLLVGARGSKILVTTRLSMAASRMGSNDIFHPGSLSEKNSWELFRRFAFRQLEPSEDLVNIGKEIVTQCAGVPLAIRVIASFLCWRSEDQWQAALSEFYLAQASVDHPILSLLMWSYNQLTLPLKVCFAYCSVFPEDFEFNIVDLISLWMAQGFLEPVDENKRELEDIGEEYILTLSKHGLFINGTMDEYGTITTSKMHDLVHDLARHVGGVYGTRLHLSLIYRTEAQQVSQDNTLRTFLCWIAPEDDRMIITHDVMTLAYSKSLRVLDLHAFGIQMLPDDVGDLIHLRYLDLSHNESLVNLPDSIANLYNLQTLKLNCCYELKALPTSTRKLVCLRRLEIDRCDKLTFMPPGFENLSSLRKLTRFLVGRPRFQSASGFESLRNLNHLRGRLMIELSENWTKAVYEASKSILTTKTRLTELGIKWGPSMQMSITDSHQHQLLLDNLQPPPSLKMLQIEGYRGHNFPWWARAHTLATTLPNLITVSIDGCGQCKTLPSLSRLQFLRHLTLRFMDDVQFFERSDDQSSSEPLFFPSLQELTLHSFYSLERWREEETQVSSLSFNCLKKLKIWSCPKLTTMPLSPNIEVLDLQNINKKLLEISNIRMRELELQTSMLPSSSNSEISNFVPRGHPKNLPLLKTLHIKGCPNLKTLALGENSKELEKLVVERLDMLSSLTEDLNQLTHLEELEVASCKDLDLSGRCHDNCGECSECSEPWKFLSNLHRLTLRELPRLVTLPAGLSFIGTLKVLCISTCNNLRVLPEWVSKITSLQHLRLEGCPALTMLPEGLKGLRSLVKVDIIECPSLMERCREGGDDWHKIKHARVLCHKSWRYALMSEAELTQKPKNPGENVVVHSEDPTIHVDVTVRRQSIHKM